MSCDCYAFEGLDGAGVEQIFIGKDLERGIKELSDGEWQIVREATRYGFAGVWSITKEGGKVIGLRVLSLEENGCGLEDKPEVMLKELKEFLGI